MTSFKMIGQICINNFRQWLSNYRVWCIGFLLLMLIHLFTKEIRDFVILTDTKISPFIFPFLFTQKYIRLLFFFPLILLYCDAPFNNASQKYILIRSGRIRWEIAQMMYILSSSLLYFIYIGVFSVLLNLPYIDFSNDDWGKVINTLYKTNAGSQVNLKIIVPSTIPEYFSPSQGMWFSFLLLSISGVFIGLTIFCINILSKNQIVGVLVASFFLILDSIANGEGVLHYYSPMSWNNIANISINTISEGPTIIYIMISYTLILCILIGTSLFYFKKKDIDFSSEFQ